MSRVVGHASLSLNGTKVTVPVVFTWETAEQLRRFLNQAPPIDAEPWIGVREAAEHLSCPVSRIYDLTSRHAIPFRKEGGRLLFKRSMLDAWVAEGCPSTPPGRIAK